MLLLENCSLKDKHTFHMDVKTHYWIDFDNVEELSLILSDQRYKGFPILAVGGGSNLLFTRDYPGLLLHSTLKTIEIIREEEQTVLVKVGSGVEWDDFVAYTVGKGWSGVENLSGIPGEVGASPVQNIGAYGSEAKDTIASVDAFNMDTLQMEHFTNGDCQFGYRNSIFKNRLKNRFIVCYVTYRLSKVLKENIQYGDLAGSVQGKGGVNLRNIRESILEIRAEKLPDPHLIGNAGSFFMNPEIPADQYQTLKEKYPLMPGWPLENGLVKISAAWCIDQAGWKGKSLGNAAVHSRQALVLINPGQAMAADVMALSDAIIHDVNSLFGVHLHPEVLFI